MEISGIPEGVEIGAIRPAHVGDYVFSGEFAKSGKITPYIRQIKEHTISNDIPVVILQASAGFRFVVDLANTSSVLGDVLIPQAAFAEPVTRNVTVTLNDDAEQAVYDELLGEIKHRGLNLAVK